MQRRIASSVAFVLVGASALSSACSDTQGGSSGAIGDRPSIDTELTALQDGRSRARLAAVTGIAATDPGPRPGPAGAGAPPTPQPIDPDDKNSQVAAGAACLPGLGPAAKVLCQKAVIRFQEIDSVSGNLGVAIGVGLGPTFNGNSCALCHSQPGVLGSSVGLQSPQNPVPNPQIALATLDGATNIVPSFITAAGPIREARFPSDGTVHDLFTIAGRQDAPGCTQAQPDFAAHIAANDIIFRIPIPLFGDGLVENTPDATLLANEPPASAPSDASLGIVPGVFNISGNDQTISRFGWKAQNPSLLVFSGEAYNVEQGVSNENFPHERRVDPGCAFNGTPEDSTDPKGKFPANDVSDANSDITNFAEAMRLSAPPVRALPPHVHRGSVDRGEKKFVHIGCANCHSPTLETGPSAIDAALSRVTFHPYSDFSIHHMGSGLSDGVSQGTAGPDQFRTAPLWGAGQRLFFLHDGRTSDLAAAIEAHASPGSEANAVVDRFNQLPARNQQDILNFLRSL